ncbi:MAG: hypothetical protein WD208_01115 [Dehalococcoidia bacterium]
MRDIHRRGASLDELREVAARQNDARKRIIFSELADRYTSKWRELDAEYFDVRTARWEGGNVKISATPEVGVRIGGRSFATKIWLLSQPPSDEVASILLGLLELAGRRGIPKWPQGWEPALWDTRRERFLTLDTHPLPQLFEATTEAELAAFGRLWVALEEEEQEEESEKTATGGAA